MRYLGGENRCVRNLCATDSRLVDFESILPREDKRAHTGDVDTVLQQLPQRRQHVPKAVRPGLQVFDDLFGKLFRFRQVVQFHPRRLLCVQRPGDGDLELSLMGLRSGRVPDIFDMCK